MCKLYIRCVDLLLYEIFVSSGWDAGIEGVALIETMEDLLTVSTFIKVFDEIFFSHPEV